MNVSSIIVQTTPKHILGLVENLKLADFCDYHLHDNRGYVIVTVDGENTGEEIEKLAKIKMLPHVLSAEMHYAYNEEEIALLQSNLEISTPPEWLNDETILAEQIEYKGDLKKLATYK